MPEYRQAIEDSAGGLVTRLNDTREQVSSNENPFMQARLNPLMARAAETRGAISRDMTRRGLGGSSLYSSGLGNYDATVEREMGDQRALATQEALATRLGIDTQIYNTAISALDAYRSLDVEEQQIAQQNLQQELAALGLSQPDISAVLGSAELNMKQNFLKNEAMGRGLDSLGRALPSLWPGSEPSLAAFP